MKNTFSALLKNAKSINPNINANNYNNRVSLLYAFLEEKITISSDIVAELIEVESFCLISMTDDIPNKLQPSYFLSSYLVIAERMSNQRVFTNKKYLISSPMLSLFKDMKDSPLVSVIHTNKSQLKEVNDKMETIIGRLEVASML